MKDKITLLVNTCDKNSFLWKPFYKLFNIYWDKSIDIKKYILSETESMELDGFDFILPGKNDWSDNLLYALNKIETKYVLWWIEDFFMINTINRESFESFLYLLEEYKADKLVVHYPHSELRLTPLLPELNIYTMNQNSPYTTTLQPSLWSVEHLKSCLIPGENPWKFEIEGSERLNARGHNILLFMIQNRWHLEALSRGTTTPEYYSILKYHNLDYLIMR